MKTLELITSKFPITTEEYNQLDKELGKLCYYAAWELKRMNSKNSCTNDTDDDVQELKIAMMRAGSYYKRQVFIEKCFEALEANVKDEFSRCILDELKDLWENRKRHGASKQKFGSHQENILEKLVKSYVPVNSRPNIDAPIEMDAKFITYAKHIVWNAQKALGKQISKEKVFRTGLVSLSEYDHLISI